MGVRAGGCAAVDFSCIGGRPPSPRSLNVRYRIIFVWWFYGFHLCTIEVPMVYTIGQLECVTYQYYFINVLFDIFF